MNTFKKITERSSLHEHLEQQSISSLLKGINEEDKKVALAIEEVLPQIEKLVDALVVRFQKGGRLFYIGSGYRYHSRWGWCYSESSRICRG